MTAGKVKNVDMQNSMQSLYNWYFAAAYPPRGPVAGQ